MGLLKPTSSVGSAFSHGSEDIHANDGSELAAGCRDAVESGAHLLGVSLCGQDVGRQVGPIAEGEEQHAVHGEEGVGVLVLAVAERLEEPGEQDEAEGDQQKAVHLQALGAHHAQRGNGTKAGGDAHAQGDDLLLRHSGYA